MVDEQARKRRALFRDSRNYWNDEMRGVRKYLIFIVVEVGLALGKVYLDVRRLIFFACSPSYFLESSFQIIDKHLPLPCLHRKLENLLGKLCFGPNKN